MTTVYQVGYEGWVEPPLVAFVNKQAAIDRANEMCQTQANELTELGREYDIQVLPEDFCKKEQVEYSVAIMVNGNASYCYWVDTIALIE